MTDEPNETNDKLAVVDKSGTLQLFQSLEGVDMKALVVTLTNEGLNDYLLKTFKFSGILTQAAAVEFHNRFKAARAKRESYCGYTDFDKACPPLTGYSSRQIRNYESGKPTPSPKELSEEEKQDRVDKAALNLKIAAEIKHREAIAEAARKAAEDLKKDGGSTKNPSRSAVAAETKPLTQDAIDLAEAFGLLRALLYSPPQSKEMTTSRHLAISFLKKHDEFEAKKAEGAAA